MNLPATASAVFLACFGPLAVAQSNFVTPGVTPAARKVVVYDQGDSWHGAFVRHADDSVSALGNPWLGGRSRPLLLPGVLDMVRLDALAPGETEVVAMVGVGGLTLVRWVDATCSFELHTVSDVLVENAGIVRAASFAPFHVIAVVTPGGATVRCYRQSVNAAGALVCIPVSSFAPSAAVLDAEVFRAANGATRLLLRTASGLQCTDAGGNVLWTAAGSGGKLAKWPQPSTVRVAWLHTPAGATGWTVSRLGDTGAIDTCDVTSAFAAGETPLGMFAVDDDHDGDVDVLVKTASGVSLLHNSGAVDFAQLAEVPLPSEVVAAQCEPDILVTHAGRRVRLVDEQASTVVSWNRVDVTPGGVFVSGGSSDPQVTHLVVSYATGDPVGGTASSSGGTSPGTSLDFSLSVTPADFAPFFTTTTTTSMQIVAWHQASPDDQPDPVPEFNRRVTMDEPDIALERHSKWAFTIPLSPDFNPTGFRWGNELYWLTVRLCCVSNDGTTAKLASEPVTLVTSLSSTMQAGGWSYVHEFVPPGDLPSVMPSGYLGGSPIGVIQRIDIPPPSPTNLIPTPGSASNVGSAQRTDLW